LIETLYPIGVDNVSKNDKPLSPRKLLQSFWARLERIAALAQNPFINELPAAIARGEADPDQDALTATDLFPDTLDEWPDL